MAKTTAPFGTWKSPIAAEFVAGQSLRFGAVQAVGASLFWSEVRPMDRGRAVIVERAADGTTRDLIGAPYSARSRVHEYGGGEFLAGVESVWFVNDADQDIYMVTGDADPQRVTQAPDMRFADFALDSPRRRLLAVAETAGAEPHGLPQNLLVSIDLSTANFGAVTRLIEGCDFYAYPRLSPDGSQFAWIEWDLPSMPWENSRLMVCGFEDDGQTTAARHVAGGDDTHVFQPQWAHDGALYFIGDVTGWGNLYRWDGETTGAVHELEADFGRPLWGLGTRSYAVLPDGRLAASYIENGVFKLGCIDTDGDIELLDVPFAQVEAVTAFGENVAALVTEDSSPAAVAVISCQNSPARGFDLVRRSLDTDISPQSISNGELLTIARPDAEAVRALYYAPVNGAFAGPGDMAPPMIVGAHGGPTGMADRGLKLKIQYWTSRGFAYLDVDYRGSAGYGRAYRDALRGQWGLHDVEDVVDAARHVVSRGLADNDKLLISGGSAGGFSVLCALTFHDVFAAGASHYGIGDLQKLLDLTHKFESGYLYGLTGTAPGDTETVFRARSPLFHVDRISRPIILFQGLEDNVVPPNQSRDMVQSLKQRGIPVAYLEFEGEGHGFRRADTIVRALNSEYAFYARVLDLQPLEDLPPINIWNEERLT
jgi:dipeptidyl aminopeptidase/acylaminoacyl peptidase